MELVDRRRNFQASLKDCLLPLEPDVLGPSHEAAQVTLWLNVLTNLEVAGTRLKQGILDPLHLGLLDGQGGGRDLLSLLFTLESYRLSLFRVSD